MAELADAQDSKSCEDNLVRVRLPPRAHFNSLCSLSASVAWRSFYEEGHLVLSEVEETPAPGTLQLAMLAQCKCGMEKFL